MTTWILIGVIVILLIFELRNRVAGKKADGQLTIDLYGDSEPLKLKLDLGIYELIERKQIVLNVVDKSDFANIVPEVEETQ